MRVLQFIKSATRQSITHYCRRLYELLKESVSDSWHTAIFNILLDFIRLGNAFKALVNLTYVPFCNVKIFYKLFDLPI